MDLGALSISLAVKDLELDEFETHRRTWPR
jgi:hypothetical protein